MSELVKEYQCPGCVNGPYPECYTKAEYGGGCGAHCLGTSLGLHTPIALGLPRGFCRSGDGKTKYIFIFDSLEQLKEQFGEYDKFNVPVWKHLDEHSNTLIRMFQPRLNYNVVHIIKGDVMDKISANYTITAEELAQMG